MQTSFTISNGENQLGPFTLSDIVAKIESFEIAETDFIYVDDQQDWLLINEFAPIKKRLEILEKLGKRPSLETAKKALKKEVENSEKKIISEDKSLSPENLPLIKNFVVSEVANQVVAENKVSLVENITTTLENKTADMDDKKLLLEIEKELKLTSIPIKKTSENISLQKTDIDLAKAKSNQLLQFVKIVNGEAIIEISHNVSEKIELKFNSRDLNSNLNPLNIVGEKHIQVRSNEAAEFGIQGQNIMTAGEQLIIDLSAKDKFGNLDENYNQSVLVEIKGTNKEQSRIEFRSGKSSFVLKYEKAELIHLEFSELNSKQVQIKTSHKVQVKAGAIAQVQVQTPDEAKAGETFKVKFIAVDMFGNRVEDFNGQINLEINNLSDSNKTQIHQTA